MAAAAALSLASEIGIRKAVLEGDLLQLIKALKEDVCSFSPIGLLVEDVKVLSQNFEQLLYSHIKRDGNHVACSQCSIAYCDAFGGREIINTLKIRKDPYQT